MAPNKQLVLCRSQSCVLLLLYALRSRQSRQYHERHSSKKFVQASQTHHELLKNTRNQIPQQKFDPIQCLVLQITAHTHLNRPRSCIQNCGQSLVGVSKLVYTIFLILISPFEIAVPTNPTTKPIAANRAPLYTKISNQLTIV